MDKVGEEGDLPIAHKLPLVRNVKLPLVASQTFPFGSKLTLMNAPDGSDTDALKMPVLGFALHSRTRMFTAIS